VDARQHAVLGPIFNLHIQDWPAHLDKIADFWALQTGGQSRYRGGFAGAHMSLGLQAEHFQHWLGLWELNNGRHLAPREAEELNARAHELALLGGLEEWRGGFAGVFEGEAPEVSTTRTTWTMPLRTWR
jgi:truncated hemoglobin YjbI